MRRFRALFLLMCLILPFSFIGCENENQSKLNTPTNLETENGVIIFDHTSGAQYYTLLINDEEYIVDYKHSPYVEIIDNQIHYDASKFFQIGVSYTIQVKAQADGKIDSSYTSVCPYKHLGSINKPTNVEISDTTLNWDQVENASYYLVKVITPYDAQIYDFNGNLIVGDDPSSIEKANLTEYKFNKNRFDFSSILTKAGNYSFYVRSVSIVDNEYRESAYTTKKTYLHTSTLETPSIKSIMRKDGDLYMSMVIDDNANAVVINCGEFSREVELNDTTSSVIRTDNLLNINLSEYFKDVVIDGQTLNLDLLTHYVFTAQVKYLTASDASVKCYIDSDTSHEYVHNNTYKLNAPNVESLEYNELSNMYIFSWSHSETDHVSGYKVFVMGEDGLEEIIQDKTITSIMLDADFNAVAVQALSVGNYVSSKISDITVNPDLTETMETIDVQFKSNNLVWDLVEDAEYLIECGDSQLITGGNMLDISDYVNSNDPIVTLYAFKNGYLPTSYDVSINKAQQLSTPTIKAGQGFVSSNKYLLTFTGVEDAIGYYVYIRVAGTGEFVPASRLYTTTEIDLTSELSRQDSNKTFEVKIQAVADPYSVYADSELSSVVLMSSTKKLDKPKFYQANGNPRPIIRETVLGEVKYMIYFYGVENATTYEILINYNKISIPAYVQNPTRLYSYDVTDLVAGLDSYDLKMRAMPEGNDGRVLPSDYISYTDAINKQLNKVTNIAVNELNGVYTLTFTAPENSTAWKVRIIKLNDPNYESNLKLDGLTSEFTIYQSVDIADYLKEQGEYQIYMTALAPDKENYTQSEESTEYASINKLNTLNKPENIGFNNISSSSYIMSWDGDQHADYYLIHLTQPNNITTELRAYSESFDINKYMTIQGTYTISISSRVNATGENAKSYESSSATTTNEIYVYSQEHDYKRYSSSIYGNEFDYYIEDVEELKNVLWYHYLFGVDNGLNNSTKLAIYIHRETKEDSRETESVREAIVRLANEAGMNDINLYNFNNDQTWLGLVNEPTTNDQRFMEYLVKTLLNLYPDIHSLSNLSVSSNGQSFTIDYTNALEGEKITTPNSLISVANDYGVSFDYLDANARRSNNSIFNIDKRNEYMYVTTTEQLLQAVQTGKRPIFIGESATAEEVYSNAKNVLRAIINDKMTDVEKTTRIFDWLESGYSLNLLARKTLNNGTLVDADMSTYGKRAEYYLEGIFLGILDEQTGGFDGEFYLGDRIATSASYSKAFALMCAIEGIDSVIVSGEYTYNIGSQKYIVPHYWNKVYLSTTSNIADKNWYVVDITFSDNRIYHDGMNYSTAHTYGISSHTYFLVTDSFITNENNMNYRENSLSFIDKNYLKSKSYSDTRICNNYYDYYANSSFKMTKAELDNLSSNLNAKDGFEYSKVYNPSQEYQEYDRTSYFGNLQNYILNSLLYSTKNAKENSDKSTFEFRIYGESTFSRNVIQNVNTQSSSFINVDIGEDAVGNGGLYSNYDSSAKCLTVVYRIDRVR